MQRRDTWRKSEVVGPPTIQSIWHVSLRVAIAYDGRMKKVYLAGPIAGCTDAEARGWRARARELLHPLIEVIDPMRRDYRGIERDTHPAEIVEPDLRDIGGAGIVLAMCERPTWGTAMEIAIATRELGAIVVAVCSAPSPSPWLRHHTAKICPTLEAACTALNAALVPVITSE